MAWFKTMARRIRAESAEEFIERLHESAKLQSYREGS